MSKVAMPEPFGWLLDCLPGGGIAFQKDAPTEMQSLVNSTAAVFTTSQVEAYADARVAESQQWISVEDRLPETNPGISGWARVLAYWTTSDPDYEPGGIETSFFDGRNWQSANGQMDYHGARRVTHWMPLPVPPLPGPVEPTT